MDEMRVMRGVVDVWPTHNTNRRWCIGSGASLANLTLTGRGREKLEMAGEGGRHGSA